MKIILIAFAGLLQPQQMSLQLRLDWHRMQHRVDHHQHVPRACHIHPGSLHQNGAEGNSLR